jgi:hypothetical protein
MGGSLAQTQAQQVITPQLPKTAKLIQPREEIMPTSKGLTLEKRLQDAHERCTTLEQLLYENKCQLTKLRSQLLEARQLAHNYREQVDNVIMSDRNVLYSSTFPWEEPE